jgi:hypothetical protein
MIMRGFGLKPAGIDGDSNVYAVLRLDRPIRPGMTVVGWLYSLPSGWQRWGYENDDPPLVRSLDEGIESLLTKICEEECGPPGA